MLGLLKMGVIRAAIGVAKPTKHMKALRAQAFYRFGEEFHSVALKAGSLMVQAYLLGQALELYLKAFLLASGSTNADVKYKYHHNLVKLLKAAQEGGISVQVSPELEKDVAYLNALYATKALQYFASVHVFNTPTLPELAELLRFAKALKEELPNVLR